jgi:hypothetical protein
MSAPIPQADGTIREKKTIGRLRLAMFASPFLKTVADVNT